MLRALILASFTIVYVIATTNKAYAQSVDRDFGASQVKCTDPNGTEIKDQNWIIAPNGFFFADVVITEIEKTETYGNAGNTGCTEFNYDGAPTRVYVKTKALIGGAVTEISVPTQISVFAHADCTSGAINILQGKTITARCHFHGVVAPLQ